MHRQSYNRGRQQQWHQSPPQRGPKQGEVHSQTPSRSPPGMSHLQWSPKLWVWRQAVTLLFQLPSTRVTPRIPREGVHLTQLGIALMYTMRCSHSWEPTVDAHPRAQHRSWCGLTSGTWMIWVIHHNCPLTLPASLNSLKMPPMSEVMLEVCLPPQPHALLKGTRWPCQRGRATSSALQMPGKPDPSQIPPHLPALQQPVDPNPNTTPHQTQSNSQRTGWGHIPWGWGNHPTGGQSSLCTGGAQVSSPPPLYCIWQRCGFPASHSPSWKIGMVGSSPKPQCPMPQQFSATWGPWGLPGHPWDEERENPGPSQSPAELFQMVW